jgi:ribosome-associated translation inhibitor RaiA
MLTKFYSPDFELSPAFCRKAEKKIEKIVKKAPFLLGRKKNEEETAEAKVTVEREKKYYHKAGKKLEKAKEGGRFKLILEIDFAGQKILADGRGDDLYFVLNVLEKKLTREISRYRKKHRVEEVKGARRWKNALRFPWPRKNSQKK